MLNLSFTSIFCKESLTEALDSISSKSAGIDKELLASFKQNQTENIQELHLELINAKYTPQPIKKIKIPKNDKEYRPIAISAIRDKIAQKALVNGIEEYFDSLMSNKSYAYRKDKSPTKAIGRCRDYISRGYIWVYKTDIDNFFEEIDHNILLNILDSHIQDKQIVRLISLYLKNGGFSNSNYVEHLEGVHQGDVLSPLLSNIYLTQLDNFLERENIEFVRYADDFTLFFKEQKEIEPSKIKLVEFLKSIQLKIEESKSYTANIFKDGFTFLGVYFKGKEIKINNERLNKKISKLFEIARNATTPKAYVKSVNEFIDGLKLYYLKIISIDSTQFQVLFNAIIDASAQFVYLKRKAEKITTKKEFKENFKELNLIKETTATEHKETIERIVSRGFEKYLASKTYQKETSKLKITKQKYAKSFAVTSLLYVSAYGAYLGKSRNSITVKVKGKVVAKMPIKQCEQIIIAGKAVSLSSDIVYLCVKEGIAIDYVDHKELPYATIFGYKSTFANMMLLQLEVYNSEKRVTLAKYFVKGKAKNQLNYLKYLDKYHNEIEDKIELIEKKIPNIKKAKSVSVLMGIEGEIATTYWSAISYLLRDKADFKTRVHKNAKDLVNSALNYGYAILYSKVRHALLKASLALNIPFLHSIQENKPALVYDFIEEYRAYIVDRAIISMFNKNEPIKLDNQNLLTKESRELIVKNIYERLGVYAKYRSQNKKVSNIIQDQAYLLARAVKNEAKYKPFIAKY